MRSHARTITEPFAETIAIASGEEAIFIPLFIFFSFPRQCKRRVDIELI